MIVLAVDTALAACAAALYESDADLTLAKKFEPMATGQAERLAPMVAEILASGTGIGAVDRIAATIGPGTFTGLRIGLSFARGLGLALALPVIGISTLKALAANITADGDGLPIVAAIDARRGNIYWQLFSRELEELTPPQIGAAAAVAAKIPARCFAVGSGAAILKTHASSPAITLAPDSAANHIDPAAVARLASRAEPQDLPPQPLYLREPDAKPQVPRQSIEIADAQEAQVKDIAALHAECFAEGWSSKSIAELLAMPGALALVAQTTGGESVGFIIARRAADEAEILGLGVSQPYRRLGVAAMLVTHAAARLAKQGARTLHIEVARSNAAALHAYEKLGFKMTGKRKNYYAAAVGGREDALTMMRPLPIAR
jgi:tRNA threonylcarbamoyl adenosine modification protein YeaZ/ribosomal-protein-alanine acetyltransferase